MTDKPAKSWSQRLRSFVAFPLPFLLLLLASLAAPKEMGEPAFVRDWSVEAKAIALFTVLFALMAGLPLLLELWAKRIDPTEFGAHERKPLSNLIDNVGGHVAMTAVAVFVIYGKELKHISLWWLGAGIVLAGLLPIFASIYRLMKRGDRS
jgi:hypothetical protein